MVLLLSHCSEGKKPSWQASHILHGWHEAETKPDRVNYGYERIIQSFMASSLIFLMSIFRLFLNSIHTKQGLSSLASSEAAPWYIMHHIHYSASLMASAGIRPELATQWPIMFQWETWLWSSIISLVLPNDVFMRCLGRGFTLSRSGAFPFLCSSRQTKGDAPVSRVNGILWVDSVHTGCVSFRAQCSLQRMDSCLNSEYALAPPPC